MKQFLGFLFLSLIVFYSCNTGGGKTNDPVIPIDTTQPDTMEVTNSQGMSMNLIAGDYLLLKNSLGENNSSSAAKAGAELHTALAGYRKVIEGETPDSLLEVIDDAIEHASHISENKDLAHQREHFDLLSRDMFDLLLAIDIDKSLFRIDCPMFNDGKGAFWISESGDNRNPYFGPVMPADGVEEQPIRN